MVVQHAVFIRVHIDLSLAACIKFQQNSMQRVCPKFVRPTFQNDVKKKEKQKYCARFFLRI